MSSSDDDWGWVVWFVLIGAIAYGCNKKPVEQREDYQSGYEAGRSDGYYAGHSDGVEEGKEEICDEVESELNYGAASAVGC